MQCAPTCPRYHVRSHPEEEGRWALPHGEFGLDVIALIGVWRFNDAIRDYCLAVRASLTDDGRSPLEAFGLRLHDRIKQISDSIGRVQEKKDYPQR